MKCAANVTVRSTSHGAGCEGSVVDWNIVAGNVSSEDRVESDSGVCPTTHQLCTSRLENLSVSSRRVDVQLRLTSMGCTSPQRVTLSLPIEASLTCTDVEHLIDEAESLDAGTVALAALAALTLLACAATACFRRCRCGGGGGGGRPTGSGSRRYLRDLDHEDEE
eukprot:CAMPEP_0172183644 /NCGR_PEP_ID=MMETSP1050-20130122/19108_1 /TAXON_ID=233186 /ORGANISM="Cryptomonas curvata, Strain CCAP979/52" /LENGTH=164 /DNA_ID=CAMNT_0012857301 /DNA_START=404 /DNA_END=895 /DNA_ORIENTATION=+